MSILQRFHQASSVSVSNGKQQQPPQSSPPSNNAKMNGSASSPPLSARKLKRHKNKSGKTSKLLFAIGSIAVTLAVINYANSLMHHGSLPMGITIVISSPGQDEQEASKWTFGRRRRQQRQQHTEHEEQLQQELHYLPPPRKLHSKLKKHQQQVVRKGADYLSRYENSLHHAGKQPKHGADLRQQGRATTPEQQQAQQAARQRLHQAATGKLPVNGQQLQHAKEVEKGEVHHMAYYFMLSKENDDDKEKLLTLLKDNAGIRMLSQHSYDQLPSWGQVTAMYGDRPRLVGMDQCEAFRANGDLADKFLAVAGAFNSGTNLLSKLLTRNCVLHKRQAKYGQKQKGIRWQVPYGKHTPPLDEAFRNSHVASKSDGVDARNVLPAVMIRDPFRWLQSMCSHHYTTRWPRVFARGDPRHHCPNLFPVQEEKDRFHELHVEPSLEGTDIDLKAVFKSYNTSRAKERAIFIGLRPKGVLLADEAADLEEQQEKSSHDTEDEHHNSHGGEQEAAATLSEEELDRHYFPVRIKYSNFTREHRSLVHFYNEWYQEYLDLKDYPHVMVRMEDLLFFPDEVVPQICACAGGQLVTANSTIPGPHPVRVVAQSAKSKHSTKYMEAGEEHTGYLDALIKYGKSDTRFRGMTPQDLQYAGRYLDPKIMELFGYDYPDASTRGGGNPDVETSEK